MHAQTLSRIYNFQTDALISWKLFYQLNDDDELQYTHTRTQTTNIFRFVYSLAHPKFRIYIIYSLHINDVRQFTNTDDLADTQTNARKNTHARIQAR